MFSFSPPLAGIHSLHSSFQAETAHAEDVAGNNQHLLLLQKGTGIWGRTVLSLLISCQLTFKKCSCSHVHWQCSEILSIDHRHRSSSDSDHIYTFSHRRTKNGWSTSSWLSSKIKRQTKCHRGHEHFRLQEHTWKSLNNYPRSYGIYVIHHNKSTHFLLFWNALYALITWLHKVKI